MTSPAIHELQQHATALRRLARDLVGANDADDVLQDAAVEVLRAPPRAPGALVGWLRSVVRHVASKRRHADAVRRRHEAIAQRSEGGEREFVAAGAAAADTLRTLTKWVTALPEPYRSTLLARYLQERSPNEIALATGVPVRTVKTRLQRGLQLLRERGEARGGDWRDALAIAFGFDGKVLVPASAGTAIGVLIMTATKLVAAVVLVALGFGLWRIAGPGTPTNVAPGDGPTPTASVATNVAPRSAAVADTAMSERSPVPVPPPAKASADEVVVHVVDAASNGPIEHFGLREHVAPVDMMVKERPLLHGGSHAGGRLVLPASALVQRNFVVEAEDDGYLPSRWYDNKDVAERDGERTIEVQLARPVEMVLRVVRERTGEPVAGTRIEVLRPWPSAPEVTLRTMSLHSPQVRVQPDESPMVVAFSGGRALWLAGGTTDAEGRVPLRVPPDELLALRLLGPGHRPAVRQPFSLAAAKAGTEVVESVASGAAIELRIVPVAAWDRLGVDRQTLAANEARIPAIWARGVRLRNLGSGELRPAGGGMFSKPLSIDEAGRCTIDGLAGGDWEVSVCYPQILEKRTNEAVLAGTGEVTMPATIVRALAVDELRIVDIDVTGWTSGDFDASVVRDGQAVQSGQLSLRVVGANGAPLPQCSSLGLHARDGRFTASLPPARYFAKWRDSTTGPSIDVPLGEFVIGSGAPTRMDFAVALVSVRFQVVEADGTTAAAGFVQLERNGWLGGAASDAAGFATVASVLRDDTVRVSFRRPAGTQVNGQPAYGKPIELDALRATGTATAIVLRLPAR